MAKYDMASSGIKIKGNDSYHVVKVHEADEWLLLRKREHKGVVSYYQAAVFSSPDEARAFANACELLIKPL